VLAARSICDLVGSGLSAQDAVNRLLAAMREEVGADVGFIAIGRDGSIGLAHGTPYMVHACATGSRPEILARMTMQSL
jgi:isoaspartyl peptidase/L-asparaginase-like protein (Ntn-hydrolase superfamily)